MFVTRLLSGIVLVVLAILILWLGYIPTGIAMCLLSLVGIYELCRVYKLEKKAPAIISYIATVLYYVILLLKTKEIHGFSAIKAVIPIMVIFLLSELAVYVIAFPKYKDTEIMAAFLSFFYVSVMLSYVYKLRIIPGGGYFVILVFIASWGNDTLAYCAGRLFGKHKMSPVLSPKKSVEGLIGGILGAGLLGLIGGLLFNKFVMDISGLPVWLFVVSAVGAIPAVIGDLAASAIKRNNDIKDYGKLIPGHGGVLDRFDSMIFTAPIIYYLILFMVDKLGITF